MVYKVFIRPNDKFQLVVRGINAFARDVARIQPEITATLFQCSYFYFIRTDIRTLQ